MDAEFNRYVCVFSFFLDANKSKDYLLKKKSILIIDEEKQTSALEHTMKCIYIASLARSFILIVRKINIIFSSLSLSFFALSHN